MRPSLDETWMAIATEIGRRSLCDGRKIGAVIVDASEHIISTGYNGPPSGFGHEGKSCSSWCHRQMHRDEALPDSYGLSCPSIHAEANALLYTDRSRQNGGVIYVSSLPCADCAKLISNSGVSRAVFLVDSKGLVGNPSETLAFIRNAGVGVSLVLGDDIAGKADALMEFLDIRGI